MYYLTDICFMCLKNSIKLQSVFIQDNDGIVFIEKLKCCFPEIINSTPDTHKLACSECLEKLRFLYDFKQSGIRNNTMVNNYLGILQCENKTFQQPSVVLPTRKRRKNDGNSFILKIQNINFNFTNGELLNKIDHSCQPTATEKIHLETKNVEKFCPVTDTETIYLKQEPQFSEDESTISCLDENAEDSEGNTSSNENDPDFEISEEGTSKSNDHNNQKVNEVLFNNCYASDVKFCDTCQDLLFKDLNNIHLHVYTHMESSVCSLCEDSLNDIHKFQRHMFNHCESMVEILDKGEHGEKFSCALCDQQFDDFNNLKQHIYDKHIKSVKCVVCSKSFTERCNLLRHILTIHCRIKLYKCKLCSNRFVCKEAVKDHLIYLHYSGKLSVCEFCQLTLKNPKALREHILKYHEEELRRKENTTADNNEIEKKYSNFAMAEESNSCTSNSYNLKESVIPNTTATTTATYCEPNPTFTASDICDICQKMFFYLVNLSEHLNTHMQEFSCLMCKDSAENISRLQRHMLTPCGNTNTKQNTLNTSQNTSNTSQNTSNTTNTRDNDKITCAVCRQKFQFKFLKKHMYNHMTNLTCVICNKTMSRKPNLQRHLLHHCDLKPLQCEVCGKTFSVKASLKYHVENAHSALVIMCQHCQKRFSCPYSLRGHIKNKHPEFMFRCEVCERMFIHKIALDKHAKIHRRNNEQYIEGH